jgi:hypothetical protein
MKIITNLKYGFLNKKHIKIVLKDCMILKNKELYFKEYEIKK